MNLGVGCMNIGTSDCAAASPVGGRGSGSGSSGLQTHKYIHDCEDFTCSTCMNACHAVAIGRSCVIH